MLLYQNQPQTPGSLGRTRSSSGAPATVDGCNGGSRRRVRDPSLVEAGVSEEEGRKCDGIFQITKQITCQNRDVTESSCIKGKDGKVVTDEIKIREIWKEYFDKLLNEELNCV